MNVLYDEKVKWGTKSIEMFSFFTVCMQIGRYLQLAYLQLATSLNKARYIYYDFYPRLKMGRDLD